MRKLIRFVIGSILATLAMGCEREPGNLFNHRFLIERGEQYCTPRLIETLQSDRLRFTARFDGSAQYTFDDRSMQSNKNKLLGFSDCNSQHHENSARFAWQWNNDQLEIYAYCYVNSERMEKFIGAIPINQWNRFEIELKKDAYLFYLNDTDPVSVVRDEKCNVGLYYMLWPYFGGSLPAPHQVRIDVRIIH